MGFLFGFPVVGGGWVELRKQMVCPVVGCGLGMLLGPEKTPWWGVFSGRVRRGSSNAWCAREVFSRVWWVVVVVGWGVVVC